MWLYFFSLDVFEIYFRLLSVQVVKLRVLVEIKLVIVKGFFFGELQWVGLIIRFFGYFFEGVYVYILVGLNL